MDDKINIVEEDSEYVMIEESDLSGIKDNGDLIKPSRSYTQQAKTVVKSIYTATVLIGDISHIYGLVYFFFHLYRNPATYAAISTIGHGPFLIFYVTFLKMRGWL